MTQPTILTAQYFPASRTAIVNVDGNCVTLTAHQIKDLWMLMNDSESARRTLSIRTEQPKQRRYEGGGP